MRSEVEWAQRRHARNFTAVARHQPLAPLFHTPGAVLRELPALQQRLSPGVDIRAQGGLLCWRLGVLERLGVIGRVSQCKRRSLAVGHEGSRGEHEGSSDLVNVFEGNSELLWLLLAVRDDRQCSRHVLCYSCMTNLTAPFESPGGVSRKAPAKNYRRFPHIPFGQNCRTSTMMAVCLLGVLLVPSQLVASPCPSSVHVGLRSGGCLPRVAWLHVGL